MQFGLLGLLVVHDAAGQAVPVAGPRLRVLLAALLVRPNTPVSADTLADLVWDGQPPPAAARTLRSHVGRLRRLLGAESWRLVTREPGYLIRAEPAELDLALFERLCRDTAAALGSGQWAAAAGAAERAQALWRGAPLLDVPSQPLHDQVAPRLEELHLQVLEDGAQAGLHLGQHQQLVPRLRELAAAHPLRERFHVQLMLALDGAGRPAEALDAYTSARQVLADQLGTDPGAELRELYERLLAGARPAGAAVPGPGNGAGSAPRPVRAAEVRAVPRQLPAAARYFVGRREPLNALSALLAQETKQPGTVPAAVIGGTAGIGKTALAVHWAHQNAERFPGGQLYVNLRGFDPAGPPLTPEQAVAWFLDALGVPVDRIPGGLDERAALYRTELTRRRVLILLDNACDAEQVRPLLPGAPGCMFLVTSRDQLTGLVALDGAVPVTLDLLSREEARELLARRLSGERIAAQPEAADQLALACAYLPLALNIVAARAEAGPAGPLTRLADELRDAGRRLGGLTVGTGAADLRAVFSWSVDALSPPAGRVFRQLGLYPGRDFSPAAATSLAGLEPGQARPVLDELTRAHLITEHRPGRYAFHDLLRAYAAEQAQARDTAAERTAAVRRVIDFYLRTADTVYRLLTGRAAPLELEPPVPGTQPGQFASAAAGLSWFAAEYPNILAAQQTAATHGWSGAVWWLAWITNALHYRQGSRGDHLAAWQSVVDGAAHLEPAQRARSSPLLGRPTSSWDGAGRRSSTWS